jgi:glycosyltransferase involved in cell wall biosynthesis
VDRTAEIVEQLAYSDPRIRIVQQENKGEAVARNVALSRLQGEFVAFLDSDDQYLPSHLENTVSYLQANPGISGVYTDGYYVDEVGKRLDRLSSKRRGPFEGDIFNEVVRSSDVFGPPICVVLSHAVIREHNLSFDTRIVIGPDWDFLTQYAEVGKFGYIDRPTCLYRVHGSNITLTTTRQRSRLSLALCRENAIKRTSFRFCSLETRTYAFYDLLINLLTGHPSKQDGITKWKEFSELPKTEQARIYRLMAGEGMLRGAEPGYLKEWFKKAYLLNPSAPRNLLLFLCYSLHPAVCRFILNLRRLPQRKKDSAV